MWNKPVTFLTAYCRFLGATSRCNPVFPVKNIFPLFTLLQSFFPVTVKEVVCYPPAYQEVQHIGGLELYSFHYSTIYLTVVPHRYNESPMGRKKSITVIEFIVSHDGKNWIARNDWLSAQASTLEELDNELKKLVKQKGYLEPGKKLDLFMAFDNSTIPQGMCQYSQHYFNRIIRVENYFTIVKVAVKVVGPAGGAFSLTPKRRTHIKG